MIRRLALAGVCVLASATVIACSGGSGTHLTPLAPQKAANVAGKALLTIPNRAASAHGRRAQFVSASALSVALTVNGGPASLVDVSSTSPICIAGSGGRTCTVPVSAPAGSTVFSMTFFDAANGGGNKVGSGSATVNVVIGTPFTVALAVNGIVASIAITVPAINIGSISVPVSVIAKDIDGNIIVGTAPYTAPITLTNSDATGVLTLSKSTVTSPSDIVTLAYTGAALASAATISGSTPGITSSSIAPAAVMPLNYFPVNLAATFDVKTLDTTTLTPLGIATPTVFPSPKSRAYQYQRITSGGDTFNGVTNVQSIATYFNCSCYTYQALENGALTILGNWDNGDGYSDTSKYSNGLIYAALPLIAGSTVHGAPAYAGNEIVYNTENYSYGRDTNGNYTDTITFPDGSGIADQDNTDGSASHSFSAGKTGGALNGSWANGMASSKTSASEKTSAPSGGLVLITVGQTSGGTTQTDSLAIPVSTLYPTGIPATGYSITTTVGNPITAVPSPCAVTVPYAGPIMPITTTTVYWYPADFSVTTIITIDYLAPSLGIICSTSSELASFQDSDLALAALPLQLNFTLYSEVLTQTDSLTTIGVPGNLTVYSHDRLSSSLPQTNHGRSLQTSNRHKHFYGVSK